MAAATHDMEAAVRETSPGPLGAPSLYKKLQSILKAHVDSAIRSQGERTRPTPPTISPRARIETKTRSAHKRGKGKQRRKGKSAKAAQAPAVMSQATEGEGVKAPDAKQSRRELLDLKIKEVEHETGRKLKRKQIALLANYTPRNLQLFQQGKATTDVDRAFNRVLKLPPKTIVEQLDQKTRH
jgi:hypothetical protein